MVDIQKRRNELGKISISDGIFYLSRHWKILGILAVITFPAGCIGGKSEIETGLPSQIEETPVQYTPDSPSSGESNQIYWTIMSRDLRTKGNLSAILRINNPEPDETVLTVFKTGSNSKGYRANITHITDNNWTKNFSIKLPKNASYFLVKVQISRNNKVLKTVENNVTLAAPAGRPQ